MQNFHSAFSNTNGNGAELLNHNHNNNPLCGISVQTVDDHQSSQQRLLGGGGGDRESESLATSVLARRQCRFQAITNAINNINQNGNELMII